MEQPNTNKSVKVKFVISIGIYNANHEKIVTITNKDCNLDDPKDFERWCDDYLETMINNYSDHYYEILED